MDRERTPRRVALLALFGLLLAAGCGGGDSTSPTGPDDDPPGTGEPPDTTTNNEPTGTLDCQIESYPCSPSEASLEALQRSDALGDSVLSMFQAGTDAAGAAAWLESREGVAEVSSDEGAVRFRLDDGIGYWVLEEGALGGPPPGGAPVPAPVLNGPVEPDFDVVASGKETKRALILSPALPEFGPWDSGHIVDPILRATRGYESGVQWIKNESETDVKVTFASYKNWMNYEVVHVSSHGRRICDPAPCHAMLVVNRLERLLPGSGTDEEKLKTLNEIGVEVVKGAKDPTVKSLAVTAQFFQEAYKSGLGETVVYLDACQTFGPTAPDLVQAIQGNSTVVLGWTEAVFSGDAQAAAQKFYEEAATHGFPTEEAYARMGGLKTGAATEHGGPPTLRLSTRPEGGDLQIREVVRLLHPGGQALLGTGGKVGIDGRKGDGVPDEAPFRVRVDGVTEEAAAEMMVHVTVDGAAAEPIPLSSGEGNADGEWIVDGQVLLPYDLEGDRSATFSARATLASGGESHDQTSAVLTGDEPLMGYQWEMTAKHTTYWSGAPFFTTPYTAEATLILTFEEGQDPQEPHPRYVLTGGTVTYSYSHQYGDCTYSAPTLTFDVTPDGDGLSGITFDTTVDPPRYSGFVYTRGPDFVVSSQCNDTSGTREHTANNVWLRVDAPATEPVSADRRSITGTYLGGTDFSTYSFVQESKYTITRLEPGGGE